MKENPEASRRGFLRKLATTAAAATVGSNLIAADNSIGSFHYLKQEYNQIGANEQVNIALIGAGGMGTSDTQTALQIPGVKLVAVCDLYDGRLKDAKTRWGADIYTTKVYKEILNRKDVDAVIIATPDHWHQQISVDAMRAGKHVYCEKPMVHSVMEGPAVIKAQQDVLKSGSRCEFHKGTDSKER
ncbi:MAG: twin-arginine translocation signal domain-containing protein [Pedobacter sp.]|nr:MAG: twin-arginine translocation signal domain-containing protein [Pedobacter sp.]